MQTIKVTAVHYDGSSQSQDFSTTKKLNRASKLNREYPELWSAITGWDRKGPTDIARVFIKFEETDLMEFTMDEIDRLRKGQYNDLLPYCE